MAVQFSLRRHRGRLSTLFLAMVLAGVGAWAAPVDGTIAPVDGAIVCEDTASVLKERDGSDKLPPDFMVKCTAWTFFRMKMMGDVRTVRFKPSYKGERVNTVVFIGLRKRSNKTNETGLRQGGTMFNNCE